jgi:hypothetical protein
VSRAESSRCRAVFHSRVISGRHPFARPALPGVTARMGGSEFHAPPPASSPLHLFAGARLQRTDARISLVTTCSQCQARHGPRTPGSVRAARQSATRVVACRGAKPVGILQPKFSGLNTFRVGSTRYLCTSPAYQPKHRRGCYHPRRKARYWARGSRLPRRDSHPLEHAALPGRTVPVFPLL